jgi:NADH:ubiquinone oxidoreductase subunit 3 (subunit A)
VFLISLILVFLLYFLNFFFSRKISYFSKNTSFESGFLRVGKVQKSFSIHFFIIILIFVIFDVEIVIILGFIISDFTSYVSFIFIFIFILGGLYLEWYYLKLV